MPEPEQTPSVVFRGGTVLTMDDAHTVLTDADMLVVGSRGHGGFTGLLLGSVSQHVAAHSEAPVVVIVRPALERS